MSTWLALGSLPGSIPEDFGSTATAIRNDVSAYIERYGAHLRLQAIERTPTND